MPPAPSSEGQSPNSGSVRHGAHWSTFCSVPLMFRWACTQIDGSANAAGAVTPNRAPASVRTAAMRFIFWGLLPRADVDTPDNVVRREPSRSRQVILWRDLDSLWL